MKLPNLQDVVITLWAGGVRRALCLSRSAHRHGQTASTLTVAGGQVIHMLHPHTDQFESDT
jgi:hypothetical protein